MVSNPHPDGRLGVALIGYSFMGTMHAQAWQTASRFFPLDVRPEVLVVAGRTPESVAPFADRFQIPHHTTDWREAIHRPDVHIVDICTTGTTHAEIAIEALRAGKHVLCEKPLANTVEEAEQMAAAATEANQQGVRSMVGFSYRRTPALRHARDLVAQGRLGTIRHIRARYLQDWIVDPEFPLVWRLRKEDAGSGALGDIGAHIIDLATFLTGQQLTGVSALTETFVKDRPLPSASSGLSASAGSESTERGQVTVDDAAVIIGRTDGGALATFEATRFATGRKNALRIEINGSAGSLAFDFEQLNELQFYDATLPSTETGFQRILVTEPDHPYLSAWWPPGHGLGYDHGFVHQVSDFARAVTEGQEPSPSFADGLAVQRVLAAVEKSAENDAWTSVAEVHP